MFLLAIDTSGKHGSLALLKEQTGQLGSLDVVPLEGGTFSAQLIPQLNSLLERHKVNKAQVGAFIVASGPGSFTGLRVGLAAVQGLAEILRKPIVALSLLEVLTVRSGLKGKVTALLDAGRGEVYAGEYELTDSGATMRSESLLRVEEIMSGSTQLITPDETIAAALTKRNIPIRTIKRPGSDALGHLGWSKLMAGGVTSPDMLEANYIRRSDAEIFSSKS